MTFSTTSTSTSTFAGVVRVIGGGTSGGSVKIAFSSGNAAAFSPHSAKPNSATCMFEFLVSVFCVCQRSLQKPAPPRHPWRGTGACFIMKQAETVEARAKNPWPGGTIDPRLGESE